MVKQAQGTAVPRVREEACPVQGENHGLSALDSGYSHLLATGCELPEIWEVSLVFG